MRKERKGGTKEKDNPELGLGKTGTLKEEPPWKKGTIIQF